jgi:catechol 2,3-dioxygenase-like lactoylglutathione lyase family enzyme
VKDLDACRAFYDRQLGLHIVHVTGESVTYELGRTYLCLSNQGTDVRQDGPELVFVVDDLNDTLTELQGRGLSFLAEEYRARCADPEGYPVVIARSPKRREARKWTAPSGG